jgi:hypothetical protein
MIKGVVTWPSLLIPARQLRSSCLSPHHSPKDIPPGTSGGFLRLPEKRKHPSASESQFPQPEYLYCPRHVVRSPCLLAKRPEYGGQPPCLDLSPAPRSRSCVSSGSICSSVALIAEFEASRKPKQDRVGYFVRNDLPPVSQPSKRPTATRPHRSPF